MDIKKLVDNMSIEELCGQVLSYDIQPGDTEEETLEVIEKIMPGSLFVCGVQKETVEELMPKFEKDKEFQRKATARAGGIPCIMAADVEHGPGSFCQPLPELPNPMAWGACNDEKLIERAGELTGRICRKLGIHYIFGPVVDLNMNFYSSAISIRAVSDDADRIIRLAGAYMRGVQKNGYLAACGKHFPGDGLDERNSHFMTTVNSLSKEEWMATYGKVYKELFKQGLASVMVGHISCPAFQSDEIDEYGALPGTFSKQLLTDLLKGELGFEGCVISDALSMIGACACMDLDKLAVAYFKAGGDMLLFPEVEDHQRLVDAVKSGEIPIERMRDAATRCLKLKEKVRLFESAQAIEEEIGDISEDIVELENLAQTIADKAVKIVRNNEGVLPIKKEKGKVLLVKFGGHFFNKEPLNTAFEFIEKEFETQGWEVTSLFFAKHRHLKEIMDDYDLVMVVCESNVHGSTLRIGWDNMMALWRGYILQHKNLVFVGMDDPYKLYDFPYAKTYVNLFGKAPCLQRSLVKLVLGKIESVGKNPISFEGYFERED